MLTVNNPVFKKGDFSADPELHKFGDTYWIYYTRGDTNGLDAQYSKDLLHWTKVENILDMSTFTWATHAFWAPTVMEYRGKYYIAFAASCIFQDTPPGRGGMGFGVSDSPAGPFVNVREDNLPMIDHYIHGAQPIDGQFFIDDDGTRFFYFGTGTHCIISILNENIDGFIPLDGSDVYNDDTLFREITPYTPNKRMEFYEGTFVIKHNGLYYLMYSVDGWDTHRYSVCYATSESPFGPFTIQKKILETDPMFANGPGHHSCLYLEDYKQWVICYHRRNMGDYFDTRMACIDKMDFDENGEIKRVRMTSCWTTDGEAYPPERDNKRNLALSEKATYFASSHDEFFTPECAFDGIIGFDSRWAVGESETDNQYLGVNFNEPTEFRKVVMAFQYMGGMGGIDGEFELQMLNNDGEWVTLTPLRKFTEEESSFKFDLSFVTEEFSPVTANGVRVFFPHGRLWLSIYELEVYN